MKNLYPSNSESKKYWGNLQGCALSFQLSEIISKYNKDKFVTVIAPDIISAENLELELNFFNKDINVLNFPDWETLPYDSFSPHQDIVSRRLATLYNILNSKQGVLIVPITTLMHKLCPVDFINKYMFMLSVKDTINIENLRLQLVKAGYNSVSQVSEHGDFVIRGSIIDLFPMGSDLPYRIDLFDDEIDSIRTFDIETQKSLTKINQIKLLPAKEFAFNEDSIALFRGKFREKFSVDLSLCDVYQEISNGCIPLGIEYYLSLFFTENLASLFDYLPENSLIVNIGSVENAANEYWQEINDRYSQYSHDIRKPILPIKEVFFDFTDINNKKNQHQQIYLTGDKLSNKAANINFNFNAIDHNKEHTTKENLFNSIKNVANNCDKVLICAESYGRQDILRDLLVKNNIQAIEVSSWQDFLQLNSKLNKYAITVSPLEFGAEFVEQKLAIITENQIFGQRVKQSRLRKSKTFALDSEIKNLAELKVGDLVVHIDHGIAKYLGLNVLSLSTGVTTEFVTLEYANNSKLYIPVSSLHLISRYSAANMENVAVHNLGNDKWHKEKQKALKKVQDVAASLLDVYAKREAKPGFAFNKPDVEYEEFVAKFPFEETIDQETSIKSIIADMTAPKPMDRVVCGDVGFGKTEVAMRAAFIAALSGKQVAVLVPTTLLADQHYQTFSDRFAGFAINIAVLSRFVAGSKQQKTVEKIASGSVDIIIGTHKLLQKTIKFKNLGLLIIDEEHRFGVKQKEKFKSLRAEIDILTLTATPIPRTLSMAMGKIRDLSIIATPPQKRLSVKTFVRGYDESVIREAIDREVRRGGQVYFLHNSVETIEKTARELKTIVPNAKIAVAHGQMRERELEKIMIDFYHRKYNVLVCTTIIETGIDIPTANTILMDRADKLGLAQLHQLRGRVGRSHHQAYAFCLVPTEGKITPDAKKRLEAISSLDTLGAGFSLASHDLEIRGAGELLGEEQSGNIDTIGFSLYMELIEKTVELLKQGKSISVEEAISQSTEIDLQLPNLIPENYIHDVHTRLIFYKRIANAKDEDKLNYLKLELQDRFGKIPDYTHNLFAITLLKLLAEDLGIAKIKVNDKFGTLEFVAKPKVDLQKLVSLVNKSPDRYKFAGTNKLRFNVETKDPDQRIKVVKELLEQLKN